MERSSELVYGSRAVQSHASTRAKSQTRQDSGPHLTASTSALGPARRGCNNRARTQTLSPFTLSTPEGGVEGGAWPDRGVPAVRTPGPLAELQGEGESEAAGGAQGRRRMPGREVRGAEHEKNV